MRILFILLNICLLQITYAQTIHLTKINMDNDKNILLYVWLNVGKIKDGNCKFDFILQPVSTIVVKNGDQFKIDGDMIKNLVGLGFNCATQNFQLDEEADRTIFRDSFLLESNSINYTCSNPFLGAIKISV